MRTGLGVLCVLSLSCGASITVPPSYAGKIRVRLTVDPTTPGSLCSFSLTRPGDKSSGSWTGFVGLARGKSLEFKVRKGTYFLAAEGCQNAWAAGMSDIKITKSTELIIAGAGATSEHPDYKRHIVAKAYPKDGGGGGGGGEVEQSDGEDTAESEDAPASDSDETTPEAAPEEPRAKGPSCAKDGAKVSGSNECCSSKTRNPCSNGDFCGWVCCSGGNGCQ